MLLLTMVNTMDQWVEESTRYKGLINTLISPMGKSDHVTLEMHIQEEDGISYRDDYKGERLNYVRVDFKKLRIYFADIEWRNIMYRKTVARREI
ncbi:hypothetical protein E2C01_061403 [Portunus trituberculatus]|uniref:Uncharacterized protein n=1 Tax=Portunus trituberculatus TaxID=210409 RepID=A0A5B7HAU3_PORTR|nr:hypothetical protein [Portunus trituberculatus]